MAQVRLDFWEPRYGASQSGCDSTHALGGREEQFSTRRLGWWACDKRLPVRVGAPSGHRLEERARPGEVCLTSGEASGPGFGFQAVYPVAEGEPSTGRGAGFAELEHIEEESLDDEDEEEAEEVERRHRRTVQKEGTLDVSHEANLNAVQINRPVGGHPQVFVTENVPRVDVTIDLVNNVDTGACRAKGGIKWRNPTESGLTVQHRQDHREVVACIGANSRGSTYSWEPRGPHGEGGGRVDYPRARSKLWGPSESRVFWQLGHKEYGKRASLAYSAAAWWESRAGSQHVGTWPGTPEEPLWSSTRPCITAPDRMGCSGARYGVGPPIPCNMMPYLPLDAWGVGEPVAGELHIFNARALCWGDAALQYTTLTCHRDNRSHTPHCPVEGARETRGSPLPEGLTSTLKTQKGPGPDPMLETNLLLAQENLA
ncbi:hypothetical protein NDU88_007826 [Pleurodeles waltl]|uniref:Uncharacterized protein n=1 Tax=Pleurodeles waltl TaxID=8319 RepID=A0AAV7VVH4_PLEWA|nr:hypothetical protein NDU88_007826 [Pleurodeles waltl]